MRVSSIKCGGRYCAMIEWVDGSTSLDKVLFQTVDIIFRKYRIHVNPKKAQKKRLNCKSILLIKVYSTFSYPTTSLVGFWSLKDAVLTAYEGYY